MSDGSIGDHAGRGRGRTGRPPLTDERRAAFRQEIARAAVELFVAQGVAATTGEQIARAVGVSSRTLWRYFPNKESCVSPLFAAGIDAIGAALRAWPEDGSLEDALEGPTSGEGLTPLPQMPRVRALLRLTRTEPGLRAVWLQAHDEAEPVFARALADRAGLATVDLRSHIQAAMLNAALRVAVEHYAWRTEETESTPEKARAEVTATVRSALGVAARGIS
ncbi:helix-turn-helix domain-containing protein [Streptomyces sp. NPDC007084]|uniref:TetR/AcrR family transcriptional regulator n=1 Tax=Streptomyces sp. NPDC007084 TaxID=3154313 RepID=UPI003452BB02